MSFSTKSEDIRPMIGVSGCSRQIQDGRFEYYAYDQYVQAVHQGAHGVPLIIPATASAHDLAALVERLDGIVLTGSPSNVAPHYYHGPAGAPDMVQDPLRDAVTLPLIRMALAAHLPLLAICRGMQELNVALGGTLHQRIHEIPGHFDHYAYRNTSDIHEIYAPAHPVYFHKGGFFHLLLDGDDAIVNSIHNQGIDELAPGLVIEAQAADGVIEAVKVADATEFAIGVQWHPEWQLEKNPLGIAMFKAFGDACRARARKRHDAQGITAA